MNWHGPNYVYRCVPAILGNDTAEVPFVFGVKHVTNPELKAQAIAQQGIAPDKLAEMDDKFVQSKIEYIEGPEIDGKKIETFDDLQKYAPPEFAQWLEKAIYSSWVLSAADRKN